MDKQNTTTSSASIMHIRPVFMCSFSTGEVCFMDTTELRECAETKRLPIDRVSRKQLEDYSHCKGAPFPEPYIEVNIDGLGEYIQEKLDELSCAVEYAEMLKNRSIRNQIVFTYTNEQGIRDTVIANDILSQQYLSEMFNETGGVCRFHVNNDASEVLTAEQANQMAKSYLITSLA